MMNKKVKHIMTWLILLTWWLRIALAKTTVVPPDPTGSGTLQDAMAAATAGDIL